jgi:hypothetical protein
MNNLVKNDFFVWQNKIFFIFAKPEKEMIFLY